MQVDANATRDHFGGVPGLVSSKLTPRGQCIGTLEKGACLVTSVPIPEMRIRTPASTSRLSRGRAPLLCLDTQGEFLPGQHPFS